MKTMKTRKSLIALMLALIMVVALAACGQTASTSSSSSSAAPAASTETAAPAPAENATATPEEDKSDDTIVIGWAQKTTEDAWRITQTKSMKDEAAARGYELIVTDAQSNVEKQISDVEDLLAQGIDYLFISPIEEEGLAPALQAAKAVGVPVFLIDAKAKGEAGVDYVTMISSDCIVEGEMAGEYIVKICGENCKVVELTGAVGNTGAMERNEGLMNILNQYPGVEVVASQTASWSRTEAQSVMANIIQATGGEFDAVFCHNSDMALGAMLALKEANIKIGGDDGVKVIGVDSLTEAVTSIIDGEMSALVSCSPFFGPTVFDSLEKYLNGETLDTYIINPDYLVDASNAEAELPFSF